MKYFIILALINLFLYSENINISINEEINFNTSQNEFILEYSKEKDNASIFILFCENENLHIDIKSPNSTTKVSYTLSENKGYISFHFTGYGEYTLSLIPVDKDEEDTFEGKFKIVLINLLI